MQWIRVTGVTLIELCFALMVAAVLASLAAPGFRTALRTTAVRSAAYDLMSDLQQTRGSAILEGRPAVLCIAGAQGCEGSNATGRSGWRAFIDVAGDARPLVERYLPEGLAIRASRTRLTFRPDALSADTGTLTICDARGIARPRAIVISRNGRPRFAAPADEACRA
jgi:type IV fimbrial biogenesis protein FimT